MVFPSRAPEPVAPESEPELAEGAETQPEAFSTASLRELVAEHLDFVWRSLRRFGVPPGDVDDAAQQVFLIANEKSGKIRRGSERSFLVGVALRVASHARRSFATLCCSSPPDPRLASFASLAHTFARIHGDFPSAPPPALTPL